jgi:polysaccharide export outer membrane protein
MPHYLFTLKQAVKPRWILLLFVVSILLNGCVTNKKLTYLQEYPESTYGDEYSPPENYRIQPNDNIYVRVSTLDPRYSAFFNPSLDAGGSGTRMDEASADLLSYPVQMDGTIEMPYIGTVEVEGLTLSEAKAIIEELISEYVTDAATTIRLVNNYVSILGYVNIPGMYPIYKQRLNIFQAISMAGDIAIYGDRYDIRIVRQTLEGSEVREFDLTDGKILDSEYYYVLPNDVIYVKPIKGRFWGMAEFPWTVIFSSITATISIILLIQTVSTP